MFQFRLAFTLILSAVLLVSCAPQAGTPVQPRATESSAQADPVAVVTSRGDELEATDPATVSLASGGVQLVEFFRFT
jgi:hypothetical protein